MLIKLGEKEDKHQKQVNYQNNQKIIPRTQVGHDQNEWCGFEANCSILSWKATHEDSCFAESTEEGKVTKERESFLANSNNPTQNLKYIVFPDTICT